MKRENPKASNRKKKTGAHISIASTGRQIRMILKGIFESQDRLLWNYRRCQFLCSHIDGSRRMKCASVILMALYWLVRDLPKSSAGKTKAVPVSQTPLKVRQGLTWNHTHASEVTYQTRTAGAMAGSRFELDSLLHRVLNYFRLLWQRWRTFGIH